MPNCRVNGVQGLFVNIGSYILFSIIYLGRFLTSKNILAMYSPMIAKHKSWSPPKKSMVIMTDVQPLIAAP